MEEKHLAAFNALPQAQSCRLIDFQDVVVVPGFVSKTFILIVSGIKPYVTMKIDLRPLIYIRQPEYWGVEVVGCQSGIGLPQTAPYSVSFDITSVLGTKGIEVIGATSTKKVDVP
jgi:hypothetical protein